MIVLVALAAGCDRCPGRATVPPRPLARQYEDPFDSVYTGSFGNKERKPPSSLPPGAYKPQWEWDVNEPQPAPLPPLDPIQPELKCWLDSHPADEQVELIVTFRDTMALGPFPRDIQWRGDCGTHKMPAFSQPPGPTIAESRARVQAPTESGQSDDRLHRRAQYAADTGANYNQAPGPMIAVRPLAPIMLNLPVGPANRIIDSMVVFRRAQYVADTTGWGREYEAQVLDAFWLIQAAVVRMPLRNVERLSRRPGIVFVRLNRGNPPPQADQDQSNDVKAARVQLGTDHFYDLGLGEGWIALLDTGVMAEHHLLKNPSHLCVRADLVTNQWRGDVAPGGGHGTATAAILSANSKLGPDRSPDAFRGVTSAMVDCFTVYDGDSLKADAAVHGFEWATALLDPVILAEMQENTADMADVAIAADHAYQLGMVVVATNGNNLEATCPGGEVPVAGQPARGRRVIGVGAYFLGSGNADLTQARGPTEDERIKPDLRAPTGTRTAAASGDEGAPSRADLTQPFGGTSGAAPYAAGAASLMRNWLAIDRDGVDPGQVYAQMILAGQETGPFSETSSSGAGKFRLPVSGTGWWGKVSMTKEVREIDIPVHVEEEGEVTVAGAIWWPEAPILRGEEVLNGHNDIDLEMRGPRGLQATSSSRIGVFERVEVTGEAKGMWHLSIRPHQLRSEPQTIYWAAMAVPASSRPLAARP